MISTCLVSIFRLVWLYPISVSSDLTWESPLFMIWSCVETNIGIACCCVPTLKGFVQRGYPKLVDSFRSSRGSTSRTSMSTARTVDSMEKIKIEIGGKDKPTVVVSQSLPARTLAKAKQVSNQSLCRSFREAARAEAGLSCHGKPLSQMSGSQYEEGIEVVTVVDQTCERADETTGAPRSGMKSVRGSFGAEQSHTQTLISGAGVGHPVVEQDGPRSPFGTRFGVA